jgi:predicted DNA-binding mobile mystery protein A
MSLKHTIRQQYQTLADRAFSQTASLQTPPEGWIRTMRKALGMSGAQLARRMGVTRARISNAEQAEMSGGATLKSMKATAQAMDCRFVYAIVPNESIEAMIAARAHRKAEAIVGIASGHMALESQTLPEEKNLSEKERLAAELAREMPSGFWDDK